MDYTHRGKEILVQIVVKWFSDGEIPVLLEISQLYYWPLGKFQGSRNGRGFQGSAGLFMVVKKWILKFCLERSGGREGDRNRHLYSIYLVISHPEKKESPDLRLEQFITVSLLF